MESRHYKGGIGRVTQCKCGCGRTTFWGDGYIAGHEPINNPDFEPDHTQYDLKGADHDRSKS